MARNGNKGTRYSGEFKEEAVRLVEEIGVKSASEKLGVPIKTLYMWNARE